MNIQFYQNTSPKNVLYKNITKRGDIVTAQLIDGSSVGEPKLVVADPNHVFRKGYANYASIDDFGRYYYVNEVVILDETQTQINLRCDVLMTYKEYIVKGQAYVIKCEDFHGDTSIPGASPVFANDGQNPDLYERLFSPTGLTAFNQLGGNYKTGAGSYVLITAG